MESLLTVLQFAFTSLNSINPKELKFLFGSEEEKKEHELDERNRIILTPQFPMSCVYYFETIEVRYKNKNIICFEFLVYIIKENNIIIDLDEEKDISFELLFYSKNEKFIPTYLTYKNNEYHQFENYGNKFRTRIFLANVDPTKLQYINSEIMNQNNFEFLNENTYQVFFRIYDYNKFEVSLTNMNSYLENNMDLVTEKKELAESEFEELEKNLKNFYNKYNKYMSLNSALNEQRNTIYSELKHSSEEIKNHDLYNFLKNPDAYKIENEKFLNLFHYDFSLNLFLKLVETGDELKEISILDLQNIENQFYKKLNNDIDLDIEQKIKILKTITIFFSKSLNTDKTIFEADYININTISKDSPYYKSKEMLKKLISDLTEESRLFEAFMYFDSKVIENILTKNEQKYYEYINVFGEKIEFQQPKFITEYGMSLMTVKEIKHHLLDLLPSIIVQIDTNINLRALYENKTKIMIINEIGMIGDFFTQNENNYFKKAPDRYVVPIAMEILHEISSHGKLRFNNNNDNSPLVIRDSKYDFKVQKLFKKIKLDFTKEIKVNKGESGRVLEHYISEDKNVIHKLKERTINTEIIDTKYWTGKNFDALHKIFDLQKENPNISKFSEEIFLDDDDNEDNYDCVLN